MGRFLGRVQAAILDPGRLGPSFILGGALVPPVLVGLALFQVQAAIMLGLALLAAGVAHGVAKLAKVKLRITPAVAAVIAVALVGPGAPLGWVAAAAFIAAGLDLGRQSLLPDARIETGILAYAGIYLASRGAVASYLRPGSTLAADEPIRLWLTYFIHLGQSPYDAVKLYVGNVPGPVFATSVMAVVLGGAWLWYGRRLSLLTLVAFFAGAFLPVRFMGWPPRYQLDSGPLWFVAVLVLADRANLPRFTLARPLLGLAAGIVATSVRARGVSIEGAFLAVAGLQVATELVRGSAWLIEHRRLVWSWARSLRGSAARRPSGGLARRGEG